MVERTRNRSGGGLLGGSNLTASEFLFNENLNLIQTGREVFGVPISVDARRAGTHVSWSYFCEFCSKMIITVTSKTQEESRTKIVLSAIRHHRRDCVHSRANKALNDFAEEVAQGRVKKKEKKLIRKIWA